MDTYRVFEELKGSLGEAGAKALVETLGGMFDELKNTVTKEDFRLLGESIDASVSRLDNTMIRLAEAQTRTEERLNELAQAQTRTEERLNELAQAQTRTEERLNELAQAQTRTETEVKSLAVALERLTIRTDAVIGRTFELQFRDRLTAYLGRFLRRGKLLGNDELLDLIEPKVTEREMDDFLRADAVASGLVDGVKSYVVIEVSSTGDIEDILRAQRRAEVLRKAGLEAIPLVACDAISPESLAFAKLRAVRVWCNGSLVEAAA
jgi:hypothetical protein